MGTKGRAILLGAMLTGITGGFLASAANSEQTLIFPTSNEAENHQVTTGVRPIPEGLVVLMAEGAARAAGTAGFVEARCAQIRDFYGRYGREHTIEIARLRHTDAEIEFWRRTCMPAVPPISR